MSTMTVESLRDVMEYSSIHIFEDGELVSVSSTSFVDGRGIDELKKYKGFSGILLYSGDTHNRLIFPDEEATVYSMHYKTLKIRALESSYDNGYPFRLIFRIKSYLHRTKVMFKFHDRFLELQKGLEVHHVDCDTYNFKLSNLWVMPKHIHFEVHSLMRNKGYNAKLNDNDVELLVKRGLNYIYNVMDLSKYREKSAFYDEPFDEDRERDNIAYLFVKTAPYSNDNLMKYLSLSAINNR